MFGKNCIKHPKITKYHQDLDMLGNMLLTINAKIFSKRNVAKIEVTWKQGDSQELACYQQLGLLIFHILPPETCSINISKKVQKICKIVVYFEVTSSKNIFL